MQQTAMARDVLIDRSAVRMNSVSWLIVSNNNFLKLNRTFIHLLAQVDLSCRREETSQHWSGSLPSVETCKMTGR
jgi:hypothetical protein